MHIRHRHPTTAVIITHFMAAISYFKCMKYPMINADLMIARSQINRELVAVPARTQPLRVEILEFRGGRGAARSGA